MYRTFFAGIGALILSLYNKRIKWISERGTIKRYHWIFFSGFLLAVHFATWFISLEYVNVAISTTLVDAVPIFLAIFGFIFFKEKINVNKQNPTDFLTDYGKQRIPVETNYINIIPKSDTIAAGPTYEFLKEGEHDVNLDNDYSAWHHINHNYEERFDAGKYLESCRKHLAKNWRYGRPLVHEALKQNDFQKAESFLVKTFSSYLEGRGGKRWYPETSLLLIEKKALLDKGDEEIASLLTSWVDVAKRLNHPGRSAAAALQAVAFHTPENWNMVLKAYRRLSKPDTQGTLAPLYVQWKNEMAARSYPYFVDSRKVTDTWIHWLIDAILNIEQDKRWFLDNLTEWLSDLKDNTKAFKKQWRWLALLTRDLPQSEKIKVKYPSFWENVLIEGDSRGDLTVSRRKGLREMKAGPYLKTALEIWQAQLRRIVPDPASAHKSNYEEYARWAQALFELNRYEYSVLITHWRKQHDRRRNLWRDMKARHLPVG